MVRVRVTPRASKNTVIGVGEGLLRLRIQAPPVDGAANHAVREFLSEILDCPRSRIHLEKGDSGREKLFRVEGMEPGEIRRALSNFPKRR